MNWITLSLVTLLSTSSFAIPGGKYLLRLSPEPGKTTSWYIDTKMTMNMTPPGMESPMELIMNTDIGMHMAVESRDEGKGTCNIINSLDSMGMTMSGMPGMDLNYRSTQSKPGDPGYEAMAENLRPMLEGRITSIISELGVIQQLQGLAELNEKLGAGGGASGMSSNPFENLQAFFPIYPSKKIRIGSSWTAETELTNNGKPMNVIYTYTLADVQDGIAKLLVNATVDMPVSEITQEGMTMSLGMKGTQTGEMLVSLQDGITQSANIAQNFQLEMVTMGMEMPATISGMVSLSTNKP